MEWPRPPPPLDGKFQLVFTFFNLKPSLMSVSLKVIYLILSHGHLSMKANLLGAFYMIVIYNQSTCQKF